MDIACSVCEKDYPPEGLPYACEACGGLYDFRDPLTLDPAQVDKFQPGIWRYRHTFGLAQDVKPVSLGEGGTPLVWAEICGRKIAFKCEYLNPSGSFKDRGSSVIAAWIQSRRITEAVEDSSGNAGASLAAYSARAGFRIRIFIPAAASGPKRNQIEAYGAGLVLVPGSRADVSNEVRQVAESGIAYASHAYLPFNLPGYATAAYEIFDQLGSTMPGAIILPVGQGGYLLGLKRGFDALRIAYRIESIPKIVGVQARACAPLWEIYSGHDSINKEVSATNTLAEGVSVRQPLRRDAVIQATKVSSGLFWVVDENEIIPGRDALAHLGFYVEPTSALVWHALVHMIIDLPDPVVVILTGSGLKSVQ
jgi:threonine synthase